MSIIRMEAQLKRIGFDRYMMMLVLTVLLATFLPANAQFTNILGNVTYWVISLLFFLYGVRLSTATIISGLANWKLQLSVLLCTFAVFPLLGLVMQPLSALWLPATIGIGFLYIGCMPSTVQSSIVFTSISNGNVAGAVCAASISNFVGIILSPLLFALLIPQGIGYGVETSAVWRIMQQILLPFVLGQLCRPLLFDFFKRHKLLIVIVDRGSILLIVYSAFSAGVANGVWQVISPLGIAILIGLCTLYLSIVMGITIAAATAANVNRADLLALFYCGSTKSLATGLPMAGILFAGQDISLIVFPLMLFHIIQLVICAFISQRYTASMAEC